MKNHIVAPRVVARNRCLIPGRWGWNPEPDARYTKVSANQQHIRTETECIHDEVQQPWWRGRREEVAHWRFACSGDVRRGRLGDKHVVCPSVYRRFSAISPIRRCRQSRKSCSSSPSRVVQRVQTTSFPARTPSSAVSMEGKKRKREEEPVPVVIYHTPDRTYARVFKGEL